MENITIREKFAQDEISEIIKLIKSGYEVSYKDGGAVSDPYFSDTYTQDVMSGKIQLFAAYKENKIIGSVQYEDQVGVAYLSQMTVDPDFRKNGVGAKLLKNVENHAKVEGFKTMQLTAMSEKGLPEYYKKLGYKEVGTKERPRYTLIVMEKEL